MNEEELRLLQAAVGSIADERNEFPSTTPQPDVDTEFGNLQPEDLEKLLSQLQEGISQSQQEHVAEPAIELAQQVQSIQQEFLPEASQESEVQYDQALLERIAEALDREEQETAIVAARNISSVSVADNSGDVKEENNDAHIVVIQRVFEEYSHSCTRANSIPSHDSSPTPSAQTYESAPPQSPPINDASVMVLQRQEQAGILISNEIYRQSNNGNGQRNSSYPTESGERRHPENIESGSQVLAFDDPSKSAERERIREENRERKKRWREVNQDRNKDNDLRCRVTKRAARLFGVQSTPAKASWISIEFDKRKQKREQKEKARSDVPGGNGSSNVFPSSASDHQAQSTFTNIMGSADSAGMNQAQMLRVFGDLMPGESQSSFTMDGLVDLILKAPPELVAELHKVATEISGVDVPLFPRQVEQPAQQSAYIPGSHDQLKNDTPPPVPESSVNIDSNTLEGLLQGLAAGGDVPEGFELLLAELAGDARAPGERAEVPANTVETPQETRNNLNETNVDELLAALAAADYDSSAAGDVSENIASNQGNIEDLGTLFGSDDTSDFNMTEETLEKIISECGINLSSTNVGGLTSAQLTTIDEAISSAIDARVISDDDDDDEQEDFGLGFSVDDMSMDEINQLLGELNPESTSPTVADFSGNTTTDQLLASQGQLVSLQEATPPSAQYATNGDQDTSAQYTPENVAAILKAIFEGIKLPSQDVSRGSKRPSSYGAPAAKRPRGPSPNVPVTSAVNQLHGIIHSSVHVLKPSYNVSTNTVSPAYVASFGNSDAMNKRLMAMKPPPYRPGGGSVSISASSAPIPNPAGIGIPLPPRRKSGEDEKKIKAMGFPPLMAGIKRKAE